MQHPLLDSVVSNLRLNLHVVYLLVFAKNFTTLVEQNFESAANNGIKNRIKKD